MTGIFRRASQWGNVLTSNLATPVSTILLCMAASGCAGLDATESAPVPRAITAPPDEKKLAELVNTAFKTAKLSGAPEVSPVRAVHDSQWGDWVFCIRSSNADQMQKYAVLIKDNTILEVRSLVFIDGCDKETYRPIEIAGQRGVLGEANIGLSTQPRARHQTRAPSTVDGIRPIE
jgi:hypothetical protein